jgi:Transposase and inactivated derivatives
MVKPLERRHIACKIQDYYGISERMSCRIMAISQNTKRYKPKENPKNERIIQCLKSLSSKYPRYGYRRLHILLLREGEKINIKRTYRLYKEAGLTLKKKTKKRRYEKRGMPENPLRKANSRWAMDFVSDRTRTGAAFRVLVVIDVVTKECLALEAEKSLGGKRVGQVLNRIAMFRGYPQEILTDNGSEFTSNAMNQWSYDHKVKQIFIAPGKPMQNGTVESLNGKFRTECLNQHWFKHLTEAKEIIESWRQEYNQLRPHMSLGYMTPNEYADVLKNVVN